MTPDSRPPSYAPPDTDTHSLHSLRSHLSAAPSYTSSIPPTYTPRTSGPYRSLIPPAPAPHININTWPSIHTHSQAYLNVAARRARREQEAREAAAVVDIVRRRVGAVEERREEVDHEEEAMREERRGWDFFYGAVNVGGVREMRGIGMGFGEVRRERRERGTERREATRKREGGGGGGGRRGWRLYGRLGS